MDNDIVSHDVTTRCPYGYEDVRLPSPVLHWQSGARCVTVTCHTPPGLVAS